MLLLFFFYLQKYVFPHPIVFFRASVADMRNNLFMKQSIQLRSLL